LRQGQIRGIKQNIKKLFDNLNWLKEKIRVPTKRGKKGRYKTVYRLEEIDEDLYTLAEAMGLTKQKMKTNIPFSVYK